MLEPKAHHVLWFMGTFTILWSLSLAARGVLHRPRVAGRPGPRVISKPALLLGAFMFPMGVATLVAGHRLRVWVYGAAATGADWSLFDAISGGVLAFAATLAAWGFFADRARGRLRCPQCWYDMAAVAESGSLTCPECGRHAGTPAGLARTRRQRGLVALAAAIALVGLATPRLGRVGRGGLKTLVPTTVMIPMTFSVPDSWIANNNPDDDWTLGDRLLAPGAWDWQRRWASGLVRAELDAPRSLARLRRAVRCAPMVGIAPDLRPTPQRIVLVVRGLAAPDAEERRSALELLDALQLSSEWSGPDQEAAAASYRAARETLAAGGEALLPALEDADPRVVLGAAEWLEASTQHRDRAVDAVLRVYQADGLRTGLGWGTSILLRHAQRRPDVVEAILRKAGSAESRVGRAVWRRVVLEAEAAALPAPLLARVDEVLRRGDEPTAALAAQVRLRGPNASPAMLDELLEQAAAPGADRARALMLLSVGLPVKTDLVRGGRSVLALALADPNPRVSIQACAWISQMASDAAPGFDRYERPLAELAASRDPRVQSAAESALAAIRAAADPSR